MREGAAVFDEFLNRVEQLEKVTAELRRLRGRLLGWGERGAWGSVNVPFPTLPLNEKRVIRVNLEGELSPPLLYFADAPRFRGVEVEVGQRYVKVFLLGAVWGAVAARVKVFDLIVAALIYRFLQQREEIDFLALVEKELDALGLFKEQREILNLVNTYMEGE